MARNTDWSDFQIKMPKSLASDPRIDEVELAGSSGSDQKYLVHLKEGFTFRGYDSRTKGFNNARECLSLIEQEA